MFETIVARMLEFFSMEMLVVALVIAAVRSWQLRGSAQGNFANQLLIWLLLLAVGVQGTYTFVGHVFFPAYSAEHIGWEDSPFQYEVGIADLTVGVLGVLAFWGNFGFRLAAAIAGIVWYWGDAVGHVRQMIVANNYAPGNAGPWFWTDVVVPLLLVVCLVVVWQKEKAKPL